MQTAFATGFLTEFIFILEKSRYDIFFFKRGRVFRVYVKKGKPCIGKTGSRLTVKSKQGLHLFLT